MTERRDFDHLDDSSLYNYCCDGGSEWTSMMSEQISQPDNEIDKVSNREKLKSTNRAITCIICVFVMLWSLGVLTRISVEGSKPAIQVTKKEAD